MQILCPFAPHLAEEIWEATGGEGFCSMSAWPEYDEAKTIDATIEIGVQVNGKVRGAVEIPAEATKEEAIAAAKADAKVAALLEGKTIVKEIYVPKRIVNIVVR